MSGINEDNCVALVELCPKGLEI
jgi:hypothetical protein